MGDNAPVRAEAKRQLRRQGQGTKKVSGTLGLRGLYVFAQEVGFQTPFLYKAPLLGKLQHHQQQERLVRRRVAAGLIDLQMGQLAEPLLRGRHLLPTNLLRLISVSSALTARRNFM